ncbi:hypothetical protein MMYC01_201574 [Madurella mycetomatis]|uniref:Uncharacterized protein n=1 Tax=Madurella mycetomatis TaxID=100816 RepID=A0A175WBT0_9PEZI|nr:hypothetical protein MMYC01_201574 [Madurella mycetomatis]
MAVFGFVFTLLSLKAAHSSKHRSLGFAKRWMAGVSVASPFYKAPFVFADGDFGYPAPLMAMSEHMLWSRMLPPPSRTPSVSSIGVVDAFLAPRYRDWETGSEFWMGSTMQNSDIQLYLWTWKGRMVCSACYNEACYGAEEVDTLLERTRYELVNGLGIASLGYYCRSRR